MTLKPTSKNMESNFFKAQKNNQVISRIFKKKSFKTLNDFKTDKQKHGIKFFKKHKRIFKYFVHSYRLL